jgi:predicted DNA-binding mobile mystery protein A
MVTAHEQLDKRLAALMPLKTTTRPSRGWVRAIRETLGMTTRQFAARLGVSQPRIIKLEKSEADGSITLESLERAAQALGCRFVYVLVPEKRLGDTIRERASLVAERHLASVEQTMHLEDQGVPDSERHKEAHQRLVDSLLRRPARLWDKP